MPSRFDLEKKIEKGHYLLKVRNISRTRDERRAGEPDYRQEVELHDQSKKPPLMIGAWDGPMVIRALLTPTARPIVSREVLERKVDDTSGIAAMKRDAAAAREKAEEAWRDGGACPDCGRTFVFGLMGSDPCNFCGMPKSPAPAEPEKKPEPAQGPSIVNGAGEDVALAELSHDNLKVYANDLPGFVPDGRWSKETLLKKVEDHVEKISAPAE